MSSLRQKGQAAVQMPLRIPQTLHDDLKTAANAEGVSLNQYCLYLLASQVKRSEALLTERGESLLRYIAQAHVLQKELRKARGKLKK